jgi:hypothetical protein
MKYIKGFIYDGNTFTISVSPNADPFSVTPHHIYLIHNETDRWSELFLASDETLDLVVENLVSLAKIYSLNINGIDHTNKILDDMGFDKYVFKKVF